jgi:hypothetical protein
MLKMVLEKNKSTLTTRQTLLAKVRKLLIINN